MTARRRKEKGWDKPTRETYARHRWRVEGVHDRAKTHHGLSRAARRGLVNVSIQAYLTAAVMKLKHPAKAVIAPLCRIMRHLQLQTPYSIAAWSPKRLHWVFPT